MRRVGLIKKVLKCANVYETKFDPGSRKGSNAFLAHGGKGAPAKHRGVDTRRDDWSSTGASASARVGLRVVYLEYILVVPTTVHPYGWSGLSLAP